MKKSNLLILLLVLGLLFIIIATVNFSMKIPNIDDSMDANQEKIDQFYLNYQKYENNEQTAFLAWRLLTLLRKMGYDETDPDYKSLYEDVLTLKRITIIELDLLKTNQVNYPETEKLSKMNHMELENEKLKYLDIDKRLGELYSKRNELTEKKENLLFRTVLFQILGLILTQVGIVLQLKWKL